MAQFLSRTSPLVLQPLGGSFVNPVAALAAADKPNIAILAGFRRIGPSLNAFMPHHVASRNAATGRMVAESEPKGRLRKVTLLTQSQATDF